jgi:hypothetical protein
MHEGAPSQEMSFNINVVYDDLIAIIGQFNQVYGESLSQEMFKYQNEALEVVAGIKDSDLKPTSVTELKTVLNSMKDAGKISEPAYDLIVGIL